MNRFLWLFVFAFMTANAHAKTLSWDEVRAMPLPQAPAAIAYGPGPQQFGELRLPSGKGPFPVAVLVHGGCWLNQFDYQYFTHLADALANTGIATWTIEYRRIGDTDGGWPNTFLDVADATDYLKVLAQSQPLNLSRVITVGHSAGGHLALWLAARKSLPALSALHRPQPLAIFGVVGLAAITDLHVYREGAPGSCNAAVDALMGGSPQSHPQRFLQASPMAMLPIKVPMYLVQGQLDPIVPAISAQQFVTAASAVGDKAKLVLLPNVGHFEPAVAPSAAAAAVLQAVRKALKLPH